MRIQVECYSGRQANERPIRFALRDTVLYVDSIQDQWFGPDYSYFRDVADDGNTYVMSRNGKNGEWTLRSALYGSRSVMVT